VKLKADLLDDVRKLYLTTTVLGIKITMPIMIAPTALQKLSHLKGIVPSNTYWYTLHYDVFVALNILLLLLCTQV
jgi:hypothetical protein